jgi:hypothetical protein
MMTTGTYWIPLAQLLGKRSRVPIQAFFSVKVAYKELGPFAAEGLGLVAQNAITHPNGVLQKNIIQRRRGLPIRLPSASN